MIKQLYDIRKKVEEDELIMHLDINEDFTNKLYSLLKLNNIKIIKLKPDLTDKNTIFYSNIWNLNKLSKKTDLSDIVLNVFNKIKETCVSNSLYFLDTSKISEYPFASVYSENHKIKIKSVSAPNPIEGNVDIVFKLCWATIE